MNPPNQDENHSSPMQFPCQFNIKVMGKSTDEFEKDILKIVQNHYPDATENDITKRYSKNQSYTALTIAVFAQNQAELDALYQELSDCESILMAL